MTTNEERALFKYVSRNITRCCPNVPRNMAEFVIPDEFKQTVAEHGDVGDSSFLSTTAQQEKTPTTASSFSHRTACDNALQPQRNCMQTVRIEPFPTYLGLSTRYTATSMELCIRSFHSHGKRTENNVHEGVRVHKTVLAIIQ